MQAQSYDIKQQLMDFLKADELVSSLARAQIEHNIVWTQSDIDHAMKETGCTFSMDDLQFKHAQLTQPEYVMAQKAVSIALKCFDLTTESARTTIKSLTSHRDKLHSRLAHHFPGLALYAASLSSDC